jgi:recombination protein RecA
MARKSDTSASSTMDEGRRSMLDKALGDIVKRYGDGSIMRLGEAHTMTIDAIPTGSLSLDLALGIGGIPRGRITEIYGPESSGKTTLCQHIVAEVQKMGGTAAYVDMEHALDPSYAAKCGVDIDNLLVSQPDTGEQALEITETLVRSGAVDLVVIDSVAALVPRSEIEGDMGDAQMGANQDICYLHEPTSHEDWSDVRQPRNHHRWKCSEILRLCSSRRSPHPVY